MRWAHLFLTPLPQIIIISSPVQLWLTGHHLSRFHAASEVLLSPVITLWCGKLVESSLLPFDWDPQMRGKYRAVWSCNELCRGTCRFSISPVTWRYFWSSPCIDVLGRAIRNRSCTRNCSLRDHYSPKRHGTSARWVKASNGGFNKRAFFGSIMEHHPNRCEKVNRRQARQSDVLLNV